MRLMVCPRLSVADYHDHPVSHFVSLVDPGEKDPAQAPRSVRNGLFLTFSDIDDIEMTLPRFARYKPPEVEHIGRLIHFGRELSELSEWALLANCEAGISRSPAAAIIILTAAGYPPHTAFRIVRKVQPEMLPNRRMMRLTDEMLDTGGVLQRIAENHRRRAFARAGYEDPTLARLREAQREASLPWLPKLFLTLRRRWEAKKPAPKKKH